MKEKVLTIVSADDWAAAFVDGELTHQGHSINIWDWLELVTLGITKTRRATCDDNWLHNVGSFPDKLEEVEGLEFDS